MKLDVLFFAAHPDDVELSAGGTLLKFTKNGKKAGIIDLTRGELGTRGSISIRKKESEKASGILGVTIRENLLINDGDIVNSKDNHLKIISSIRKYRPDVIFIPYFDDRHPDHQNANKLIREASFYSGLPKIVTKLKGKIQEPFRTKRNIYYMQTYTFEPSFIVDISDEFDVKMKAVMCYASQFYSPGSKGPQTFISDKKFIEYLEARAKFYGFKIGKKYGEPFYIEEDLELTIQNLLS